VALYSADHRFKSGSFKKAGVDQLLKKEPHVRDLTLLSNIQTNIQTNSCLEQKQ